MDEIKEAANRRKHGVSFAEAETVFADDHALLVADPDHSDFEDRFILMGSSSTFRTLVVCHCYRKTRETIDDSPHLGPKSRSFGASAVLSEAQPMRKTYDFSQAQPNPYAKRLKKQVTIRLDPGVLAYFQGLAEQLGIPYQTLINLFLKECAAANKRPTMTWRSAAKTA